MRNVRQLLASGIWAKTGTKRYRHVSGVEVFYANNSWGWKISTDDTYVYPSLGEAVYQVERTTPEGW